MLAVFVVIRFDNRHQIVNLVFMILLILFFGWLVISTLSTVYFASSRDQNRTALGELTEGSVRQLDDAEVQALRDSAREAD